MSREDRIAKREHGSCEAYGCPMLGTLSTCTTGGGPFYCWLHFRAPISDMDRITVEIKRNAWLTDAIRDLRVSYGTDEWRRAYLTAKQTFEADPDRFALMKTPDETVSAWFRRLEVAMTSIVAPHENPAHQAVQVAKQIEKLHEMQRVRFDIPEG